MLKYKGNVPSNPSITWYWLIVSYQYSHCLVLFVFDENLATVSMLKNSR